MSYKNLTTNELKVLMKDTKKLLLIDIRDKDEFEEFNIENAINMPLQEILYNIDELREHNDKSIVIYCRSGKRSITACNLLSMEGINNLYNLENGIKGYVK